MCQNHIFSLNYQWLYFNIFHYQDELTMYTFLYLIKHYLILSSRKQESSKKNLLLFYWLCQSLWLCGSQQIVENSERDGNTRPPYLPLRIGMQVKKQQLELDMEQLTGSKGKGVH